MSSHPIIAVATDALRGQLQSVMPEDATVIVGAPSPDGQPVSGLFVQLLRVAENRALKNLPSTTVAPEGRLTPALPLQLDYLIGGLGGEALAELALLDAALQEINDNPMRTHERLRESLSQPERWESLAPGSMTVRWSLLDLPLEQVSSVWVATGMRQRAGFLVGGRGGLQSGLAL